MLHGISPCKVGEGKQGKLDAQRQYMVIGTLALLLIFLCDFLCEQGSGPGGDRRG